MMDSMFPCPVIVTWYDGFDGPVYYCSAAMDNNLEYIYIKKKPLVGDNRLSI